MNRLLIGAVVLLVRVIQFNLAADLLMAAAAELVCLIVSKDSR